VVIDLVLGGLAGSWWRGVAGSVFLPSNISDLNLVAVLLQVPYGQIWSAWEWYGAIGKALKIISTAIFFWFFNFTFEYLKRLQNSEPLHTKINQICCLFGLQFELNPFFLLAGALSFDEKIRQRVAILWFGLRDVRVSSNILLTSRKDQL
jgi:hypothetical protein